MITFRLPKPGSKIDTYENGFINSYGYNGENYDKYTGIQYLRARYYEPETARFLTNLENAKIDPRKLTEYALNLDIRLVLIRQEYLIVL